MLALICDLALFTKKDVTTFASDEQKLRNFQLGVQREMMVDVYYNVYIFTAQVHPFMWKGCALCYIHIYLVGVGVFSSFLSVISKVS